MLQSFTLMGVSLSLFHLYPLFLYISLSNSLPRSLHSFLYPLSSSIHISLSLFVGIQLSQSLSYSFSFYPTFISLSFTLYLSLSLSHFSSLSLSLKLFLSHTISNEMEQNLGQLRVLTTLE